MKTFLKKYGKWIAFGVALLGLGYLLYRLLRAMEYRFSDTWESTWFKAGKTHAEIGAQSVIPQEFWGKETLVLNTPTALKAGDKVEVTYDSASRASGTHAILYVHGRNAIVLDKSPSPSGGPWAGTVKLVTE